MGDIENSIQKPRAHPDIRGKRAISSSYSLLGNVVKKRSYFGSDEDDIYLGDDTTAIPQEDGSH